MKSNAEAHKAPWFTFNAAWWPEVAEMLSGLGGRWPEWAASADLRWWADQARMKRVNGRPGRGALMARWGWTEKEVRNLLRTPERWACPVHGDPLQHDAGPAPVQRRSSAGPASSHIREVEPLSRSSAGPAPVQRRSPRARLTEEQNPEDQQQATPQTPTGETSPPPEEAPPAHAALQSSDAADESSSLKEEEKPKGTPIRKAGGYLRLWKILEGAGLHTLEAVAEISRDGVAQRCAPYATVYHLDELARILHRHGLDYAPSKPQAPRGTAGGAAAWEKVLKALKRFQGSPPWTGEEPWSFPGGSEVQACYAAGICAAGGDRAVSASWRTLWKAAEGARWEQRQRFVAAFGAVAVAA